MSSGNSKIPLHLRVQRSLMPLFESIFPRSAGRLATKMFFTPIKFPIPEEEKDLKSKALLINLSIDNNRIQGYVWNPEGKGPKIFLMHGWASRATHFTAIIEEAMSRDFRIFAIDGPAHGGSYGESTDVIEFAEAIKKFVKTEGKFDAAIGHSMGGTALLYAMKNGLKIPHLTLMAVPALPNEIIKVYAQKMNISAKTTDRMLANISKAYKAPFFKYTAEFLSRGGGFAKVHLVFDKRDREVSLHNLDALADNLVKAKKSIVSSLGHAKMLSDSKLAKLVLDDIEAVKSE